MSLVAGTSTDQLSATYLKVILFIETKFCWPFGNSLKRESFRLIFFSVLCFLILHKQFDSIGKFLMIDRFDCVTIEGIILASY